MTDEQTKRRIHSVDFLRGVVMMIMLLDHVREFVHAGALQNDPTNPETTTAAIFFTRWITHFCAPAFVFLSGTSVYLQKMNGKRNGELSRFLLTRGLWLIFLEFTLIRFGIFFNVDYSLAALMQVIWVIGVSMIVMAAMIYLPVRLVGIIGVAMIALHNLLDRFDLPPNISFAGDPPPDALQTIWLLLHQPSIIPITSGSGAFSAYPIIPWVGVMMAGYALGKVFEWNERERVKLLYAVGLAATLLFVVVRVINVYGDPVPWKPFDTTAQTLLSFLNVTKYPPSLLFLLMTLGPSLIVLAAADAMSGNAVWQRIGITFGRVPMFYYILQWFYAHGAGVVLGYLAGVDITYLFMNIPASAQAAPPGHGFSLAVTYVVWLVGLVLLYPLCKWWGELKRRNKHWALSYL
jgi:uncharacterized membrane protein